MINNIFKKIWFIIAATFLVFVSINSIKINTKAATNDIIYAESNFAKDYNKDINQDVNS